MNRQKDDCQVFLVVLLLNLRFLSYQTKENRYEKPKYSDLKRRGNSTHWSNAQQRRLLLGLAVAGVFLYFTFGRLQWSRFR